MKLVVRALLLFSAVSGLGQLFVQTATFTNAQLLFPCSDLLNNPYGVCSNISNDGTMWEYERRDEEMAILRDAGIGIVRTGGGVGSIAPDKNGMFHPEMMDSMVFSCLKNNIQIEADLFLDANGRAWNNYMFYEKYVRYMGTRYRGVIPYWEATNEVNLLKDETNLARKYTDYLSKVYPWLKQSDPNINVLLSGLGDLKDGFIEELSKLKAYQNFDIMNFHSYELPENLISKFKYLDKVMSDYGWRKPVWLTECGMHTAKNIQNMGFYEEIVPHALKQLGLERSLINIGVIKDGACRYQSFSENEEEVYLHGYKSIVHLDFDALQSISIYDVPVLIATNGSSFPGSKIDVLVDYVKRGGTIITPFATPFLYDLQQDGSIVSVGDKYLSMFHISHTFPWSIKSKIIGVPEVPSKITFSSDYKGSYSWSFSGSSQGRYADDRNLKKGDQLIPYISAGNDIYSGCVAGLYKLNSDLKGNIIFQTRICYETGGSEAEQARRLPRIYLISFAYGVDKVFWYNLRSRENDLFYSEDNFGLLHCDLSPKPAFEAYKFLIKMCPDKSTRPTLEEYDDIYVSEWTRPDKNKVWACWSLEDKDVLLDITGRATYYDYMGNKIDKPSKIGDGIIYIVGATNVEVKFKAFL